MDINIRPEVNILGVLRHLNYKPWFALAEFVDNSLVSALSSGLATPNDPLRVAIEFESHGGGRIVIRDNAAGIAASDFPRAFRAAQVPPDRSGLAEFGMGMKSAASWFARQWKVTTSIVGESVERVVEFNLDEIHETKRENIHVLERPAPFEAHFTTIELRRLNHVPQTKTVGKIREHLASIYREFIRAGSLDLRYRGERLAFQEVEPLVAPLAGTPNGEQIRWLKPIRFDLDETHHVYGFAALRAKGSTAQAGFALFRRQRLIVGSADETYRPVEIFGRSTTHTFQRLYGELTLDGFEVSHTKDGFRWDEYEDLFLTRLRDELASNSMNLLFQASNYRLQPITDNRRPVEAAITITTDAVRDHFEVVAKKNAEATEPEEAIPATAEIATTRDSINRVVKVKLDSEVLALDWRNEIGPWFHGRRLDSNLYAATDFWDCGRPPAARAVLRL